MLTPALEDYIETIFLLQEKTAEVKVRDIAARLGVTMASVTGGMRKLAAMEFIKYEKRHNVQLTEPGRRIAEEIYRRHEEMFEFYHKVLGVEESVARDSACKVEHYLDSAIIEKTIVLKNWMDALPADVMADFDEKVRNAAVVRVGLPMTLDRVPIGKVAIIKKINKSGEIGRRILDMGITKGAEVKVIRSAPLGDPIDIQVMGYHLSLRKSEAARIEVEI